MFRTVILFVSLILMALIFAILPAVIVGALLLNFYAIPEHVVIFWVVLTYAISAFALWVGLVALCMNSDDEEERTGYRRRNHSFFE